MNRLPSEITPAEPPSSGEPAEPQVVLSDSGVVEDNDGRELFSPESRYTKAVRKQQNWEGVYVGSLLAGTFVSLTLLGLGVFDPVFPAGGVIPGRRWAGLALGGLLGGLVYGAKWLYHSVAKGLWHEDRRIWRFLSPWIAVGTTVGIWALMDSGFFPPMTESDGGAVSTVTPIGIGFTIGYLADKFLAKMKDLTAVLFGQPERHFPATNEKTRNESP